jgi:hypothetical protein
MNNIVEKLIPILEKKVEEGLEELPKLSVKTEEYATCLTNTLTSQDLLAKLTYKPQPQANLAAQAPEAISKK